MAELSVVDENFAKMVQNPIADLISLPFQNNTNYGLGKYNRTQDILYAQPLLPFNLNPNWTIYSRTIIPYIVQPDLLHPEGYTDGLGDIIPAVLIGPRFKGGNFLGSWPNRVHTHSNQSSPRCRQMERRA
ncbi:MAG: hypothetical protein HWD59_07185 [Coxiellaceae bacterium]|nr:MAG: hypothetical protein HWD59_07185 [Coxiellaceae bacterium]